MKMNWQVVNGSEIREFATRLEARIYAKAQKAQKVPLLRGETNSYGKFKIERIEAATNTSSEELGVKTG